jgi:hypothetical protein
LLLKRANKEKVMSAQSREITDVEMAKFLMRCDEDMVHVGDLEAGLVASAERLGYCRVYIPSRSPFLVDLTTKGRAHLKHLETVLAPREGRVTGFFMVVYKGLPNERRLKSNNSNDTRRWYEWARTHPVLSLRDLTDSGTYLETPQGVVEVKFWAWPCPVGSVYFEYQCYGPGCTHCGWESHRKPRGLGLCGACWQKENQMRYEEDECEFD